MNKIDFKNDVAPHAVAVLFFLVVTTAFFSPAFFENRALSQGDIQQHIGSTKDLQDYREATGKEGLWAGSVFSGMPAYLVSVDWSDDVVVTMKKVLSLFLAHPYCNVFLAFIGYYIVLIAFRIRPWFAMAGALAFGLSSHVIIGLVAGHNARIGAIAFMPMVIAGIHLAFTRSRMFGFAVTAGAMAMHLRENHMQITYYMLLIVLVYGAVQLVQAVKSGEISSFLKTIGVLTCSVILAAATFFGQFWAITEFTKYSYRGTSELVNSVTKQNQKGLSKEYAFQYSNGLEEPMTLLIPNYFGGSSSHYLYLDTKSKTYEALVQSGNEKMIEQLAPATSPYWGPQQLSAPYYAGATLVLLFVLGAIWADRYLAIWLVSVSILSLFLSWGENFSTLNYFLFDNLPGYNKFRSVTFSIIMILFAIPLLGMLGLEKISQTEWTHEKMKRFLWPSLVTIGIVGLLALSGGFGTFLKPEEAQYPAWFKDALRQDRMDLFSGDAWRSFWFIAFFFGALFVYIKKWIQNWMFIGALLLLVGIDIAGVTRRYITKDNYQRKRDNYSFAMQAAEKEVLKDTTSYRVYAEYDGAPSYYFRSTGGYSGARLGRYQEVMDSCLRPEFQRMVGQYQTTGKLFLPERHIMSMLNVKYFIAGPGAEEFFRNDYANGPAWFVDRVEVVQSPNEEFQRIQQVDTRKVAVVDISKFPLVNKDIVPDSLASISLTHYELPYLKYESNAVNPGLAVFSEIHYPEGWHAFIDGKEAPILRADYVLRALEMPAGRHVIEFKFEPKPYLIGNKVTLASSWILILVIGGCLGYTFLRKESPTPDT